MPSAFPLGGRTDGQAKLQAGLQLLNGKVGMDTQPPGSASALFPRGCLSTVCSHIPPLFLRYVEHTLSSSWDTRPTAGSQSLESRGDMGKGFEKKEHFLCGHCTGPSFLSAVESLPVLLRKTLCRIAQLTLISVTLFLPPPTRRHPRAVMIVHGIDSIRINTSTLVLWDSSTF